MIFHDFPDFHFPGFSVMLPSGTMCEADQGTPEIGQHDGNLPEGALRLMGFLFWYRRWQTIV